MQIALEGLRTILSLIGFLVIAIAGIGVWIFKNHVREDSTFQSLVLSRIESAHASVLEIKQDVAWLKKLRE